MWSCSSINYWFFAPFSFSQNLSVNTTLGQQALESHGLNFDGYFYWISIAALTGFTVLFNVGFTLALTFLKCKSISLAYVDTERNKIFKHVC